jgi:thioredoxin 1
MKDSVIELNDENFKETIGSGVTLVDFWAPWCGPCMMQGPIIEELAGKVEGKARVAKVNVDESMQTAIQYRIQSIPTLMIFKDGEIANQLIGLHTEEQLLSAVNEVS